MDNKKKVSVIIPVYQVENYLERAVDSVLAQTLEEIEIILVDDGSEDRSGEICDWYQKEYPEKIQVIHKKNQGLGMARNSGVTLAHGEYIAFLDSDDTVEPQMYEDMYEKAVTGNYDIVMCDVRIIYVEENRTVEIISYPEEEIDVGDYIARGNNITYSVNKLFRHRIWEEHQYEQMLFEDISLIPSLITLYPNIGYVKRAFYNYYRRANTISTSLTGNMTDIIKAYKNFIKNSTPAFHQEVIYCAAKQIYWNMTDARVLFQADFIDFLQEYKQLFLLNTFIEKDPKVKNILGFIQKEIIPNNFICVSFERAFSEEYETELKNNFPTSNLIFADRDYLSKFILPESVLRAYETGNFSYVEEYIALKILAQEGGIVVFSSMQPKLQLKKLRINKIFFGFENEDELSCGCFGALKSHYIIQALLDTYEEENIFNTALLPLQERLRDFLIIHFRLRVNGRNQLLKNEVQMYLPSILCYDMHDGENCCRHFYSFVPEGYELISEKVIKLWSDRLMENWNLYKKEMALRGKTNKQQPVIKTLSSSPSEEEIRTRIEAEIRESYENSTCWKLTRPLRVIGNLFGKNKEEHT